MSATFSIHVHADGSKKAYDIFGREHLGKQTPLVLVNGMSMLRGDWQRLSDALSQNRPVLVFDHRGMGDSTFSTKADEKVTLEMMARDLLDLIVALNRKKIAICGYSMGGAITQQLLLLPFHPSNPIVSPFEESHVFLTATVCEPQRDTSFAKRFQSIPPPPEGRKRTFEEKRELARPTAAASFDPKWVAENPDRFNWWLDRMAIGGRPVRTILMHSGCRLQGQALKAPSIPGPPLIIAPLQAFGLIVRRVNDEPFDVPSVPGSRAVVIKSMIPNSGMGSVIGKQGCKIKEIQDASGARLNASEGMLPGSTERVLSVAGVADAIHIATYYIGNILIEANERLPSSGGSSYRPSSSSTTSSSRRSHNSNYSGSSYVPGAYPGYAPHNPPQPMQTQQIYIPNGLVGCIIGKGGSKINEIRHMSASQIKIMEPGTGADGAPGGTEGERLVVITGQPANVQMAVQLLYHRLEQEKQKQLRAQQQMTESK